MNSSLNWQNQLNKIWNILQTLYLCSQTFDLFSRDVHLCKFRKWENRECHDDADRVWAEEGREELGEGDGQSKLGPQQDVCCQEVTWNYEGKLNQTWMPTTNFSPLCWERRPWRGQILPKYLCDEIFRNIRKCIGVIISQKDFLFYFSC